MIALAFIMPVGSVIGDDKKDADSLVEIIAPQNPGEKERIRPLYEIDQATNPVVEMATTTGINSFILKDCTGEDMYQVSAGSIIPFEDCYRPMFKLETLEVPSVYEPEIEIYKMNADADFCIYETSFEDNALNYLEWGQIDKDCLAPGGYYDGWVWSDARACGSDHSFKSTMYDEYKNMQDDVLYLKDLIDLTADEFVLCDGSVVEIGTVGTVTIKFDTFVDGERNADTWDYSNPYPLDYLQLGIIDGEGNFDYVEGGPNYYLVSDPAILFIDHDIDGPDSAIFWSTQVGLFDVEFGYDYTSYVEKIDGCPGWWHVEWEVDVGSLQSPDEFGVFFEWRSDKERVYEGAYVDNVEITITEDIGEKIYQGHSQNWLTQEEEGIHYFTFPLEWDDDIEVSIDFDMDPESTTYGDDLDDTYYLAICKIKDDTGGYADWKEIEFEIGDYIDCDVWITEVEDDYSHDTIPDGGILQYPSDAHIKFCYENQGNVPVTNTEVTATGYKLVKETLFEDDFDGMLNWVYFEDDYPLYQSDKFSWSGSSSLAFNQPENSMIVGGSGITDVEYIGYSNDFFSMEGVEEAVLDFYYQAVLPEGATFTWCMLGYHYIILITDILEGPVCQKTWIGPMQPQGQYESIDFDYWFDVLVANEYMKDDNGHETYETGLGFFLDTTNVNKEDFVPVCCFEPGEVPWSGVYIDDVSITAKVRGPAVWTDSMVIPGPCDPGEKCCDQFTWEDVPYSNYIIEVSTICDDDDWEIIVLENLEQASKIEAVDYTECEPESWCISDVVGNDCDNDHYALATNCDTNEIPEGVNDYIGLANIDITHLDIAGMPPPPPGYCQPMQEDIETYGHGPFSSDYYPYRVYDEYDLGAPATISDFSFYGLEAYGDDSWDGEPFNVGFFNDASGSPGSAVSDQVWWATSGDCSFVQTWLGYTIWLVEGTLPTPVSVPASGWFSVQSAQYANGGYADLAWIDDSFSSGNDHAEQWYGGSPYSILTYDVAFCIGDTSLGAKGENCSIVFDDSFESLPFDANWDWNTGWLDSLYGFPCEGSYWAYSWAAGDEIGKNLPFGNYSTTLSFAYFAESDSHPMDLELWVDGSFYDGWYGFTHTDCLWETVTLPTDPVGIAAGPVHSIAFRGMTSDFYGQILDDVLVEACDWEEEPIPEGDHIWFNMTYQCDIREGMGGVILEVAGYEAPEDGYCDGCDTEYGCPMSLNDWEQIETYTGNAPGICQTTSVDLAEYLDANDTHLCVRLRLKTDEISPFRDIPGIGFHVHSLSIANLLYDEILGVSDFVEDFEDANFVNEESGLVWNIDCVTYGTHVTSCSDFQFCIADECPTITPYECNTATLYGYDSYGDGWHGEYPYTPPCERFIDVYVNGILVVDAFTVDGLSQDSTTLDICPGDEVTVDYYSPTGNTVYIGEESWEILDGLTGMSIIDGGGILGVFTATVPTNIYDMSGTFPAEPIDEAIIWSTEIEDAYEAWLTANWAIDIPNGCIVDFEISADGGDNWFIIAHEEGPATMEGPIPGTPFDLTPWAGNSLLVRLHLQNIGVDTNSDGTIDAWYDGYVCIDHIVIQGKQDLFPPTATISLSGNAVGPGLYAGPVKVTINAVDDMAMGEIHYVLDGTESVVSGNKATFTVSGDGDHTIEFWAVDATGNEGGHSSVSFSIDNSPPDVTLTAPTPGLYLFGNKLLDMGKVFIIGAFTAGATASDAQGVAVVKFMLNGEVVGEDTSAPYSVYIAQKNMGAATLEVVAEDGVGNTASDSIDITYYKFL